VLPIGSVTEAASDPLPNTAVLEGDDVEGWEHPCVLLEMARPVLEGTSGGLYVAGFTAEPDKSVALTGATTEFESVIEDDGHEMYKLKRSQMLRGFSGSPLLDLDDGSVVAMVERSRGRYAELGGFAVCVADLVAALPECQRPWRSPQRRP
jgi:hypothetical protein